MARCLLFESDMPSRVRSVVQKRSPESGVVVLVPSAPLRQRIVNELAMAGHRAWSAGSIEAAMDLVETRNVDTVVLHVSAFSATHVSQVAGALRKHRSVSLIASISVISLGERVDRRPRVRGIDIAAEEGGGGKTSVYWLPFSYADHPCQGLYGCVLN
jgi:PleD family two-component response regulator